MTIAPVRVEEYVVCECGATMTARSFRELREGERGEWLYWGCEADPTHVTAALPLPERFGGDGGG